MSESASLASRKRLILFGEYSEVSEVSEVVSGLYSKGGSS